jgi:hypothetical protein
VYARELISQGCVWARGSHYKGIILCQRAEFEAAGGYDERFEFYGPEDRDLEDRLTRRGAKMGLFCDGMISVMPTPNEKKIANYRLKMGKEAMSRMMRPIYEENKQAGALTVNEGKEWGVWT